MDREQEEIQFIGFFGIFKESFNIVSTWKKIFIQITLSLILPLSFIYLLHIQISELLFRDIMHNEYILKRTPEGSSSYHKISNVLNSEWTSFFLFKLAYLVFFLVLALLSTSAVVYTVACIYTAKDVSLSKVLSVVPKVWKRLAVTFTWNFIIIFLYNVVAIIVLIIGAVLFAEYAIIGPMLLVLFLIEYVVGIVYISVIWHLASVVSVLEERYGLNAMTKSQALIKGKMSISIAAFLVVGLCFLGIEVAFHHLVVLGNRGGIGNKIAYGIICLVLLSSVMLLGLIVQTIIYFICKSYHHENIDKSSLSDHLEGYLGDYVPLKAKDVQLEQYEV